MATMLLSKIKCKGMNGETNLKDSYLGPPLHPVKDNVEYGVSASSSRGTKSM
jgi:hypothetical protein